jgi:type IV pilus assembly protein PilX
MNIKHIYRAQTSLPSSQGGAVLIVGLVMVLLITIVSLSAIRGTGLQENMAGNMRDRNIAFQAAESALREGEWILSPSNEDALPSFSCLDGQGACLDLSATPKDSVTYLTNERWKKIAKQSGLDIKEVSDKPSFLLEELEVDIGASAAAEGSAIDVGGMMTTGDATPYRATARGFGLSPDAEAIVQSAYKRRFK